MAYIVVDTNQSVMRSLFVCLLLCSCLMQKGYAQFYHQVGAGLFAGTGTMPRGATGSSNPSYAVYGAFYFPRINAFESKTLALSASAPITAGILADNEGGSSRIGFGVDVPLMVDLSIGAGSSDKNENTVGGFIGAGFGFTHANQKYTYSAPGWTGVERYKGTSYGPVVHTGFRYAHYKYDFTIRVFYKKGLEEQKFKTFGIAGSTTF